MSNRALALASLVMAIPAGLACYVCVDSIFKHGENAPGVMTGILWTLVILCGLLALSPIIFLLRKGSAAAPVAVAPVESEPAKKPAKAASDDEFGDSDEDDSSADSEQLFDEEDAVADDDFDDNFDFDEEPEEEAPKKKKKK